jgi:hypothetical protein
MKLANTTFIKGVGFGLLVLMATLPPSYAERPQHSGRDAHTSKGGSPSRGGSASRGGHASRVQSLRTPAQRGYSIVNRPSHGTIRHVDTNAFVRPLSAGRDPYVQQRVITHHDVDVDVNRSRHWHGFVFGARHNSLRTGYVRILVNNSPYYYDDGIYYQQTGDYYQEVYPPVGANIVQLPDGAVEIFSGNLPYYYAAGAFYVQQNGGFIITTPPMGVTVTELPPGAVQVSVGNSMAYQFNGIHYRPVFANGVTQYMTFMP